MRSCGAGVGGRANVGWRRGWRRACAVPGCWTIPDAVLRQAADPADADGDGVSGRPGAGRFGRKAEHATLTAAIGAALVVDMGLATPLHPRPAGDCTPAQPECLAAAGAGAPVAAAAIERLAAFVAALRPRPAERSIVTGTGLFGAVGCGTCHAGPYVITSDPAVTGRPFETIAPFTDLLLHDLGPGLPTRSPRPAGSRPNGGRRRSGGCATERAPA